MSIDRVAIATSLLALLRGDLVTKAISVFAFRLAFGWRRISDANSSLEMNQEEVDESQSFDDVFGADENFRRILIKEALGVGRFALQCLLFVHCGMIF